MTSFVWVLCAAAFVAFELLWTTFVPTALALASLAGAVACFGGLATSAQFASVVLVAALLLNRQLPLKLRTHFQGPRVNASDIGSRVEVLTASSQGLQVAYQGSQWPAKVLGGAEVEQGQALRVVRADGLGLVCREA